MSSCRFFCIPWWGALWALIHCGERQSLFGETYRTPPVIFLTSAALLWGRTDARKAEDQCSVGVWPIQPKGQLATEEPITKQKQDSSVGAHTERGKSHEPYLPCVPNCPFPCQLSPPPLPEKVELPQLLTSTALSGEADRRQGHRKGSYARGHLKKIL